MKETGVVRRLDELGRVVIPKEIRKRLKIKNGDMVDIYTTGDSVVIQKFHPLEQDIQPIRAILEALASENKVDLILFDEVRVIYSTYPKITSGDRVAYDFLSNSTFLEKELSPKMQVRMIEDKMIDSDVYIQKIKVNFEDYGYIAILDDMIGKKHKDILGIIQSYFKHILEN